MLVAAGGSSVQLKKQAPGVHSGQQVSFKGLAWVAPGARHPHCHLLLPLPTLHHSKLCTMAPPAELRPPVLVIWNVLPPRLLFTGHLVGEPFPLLIPFDFPLWPLCCIHLCTDMSPVSPTGL